MLFVLFIILLKMGTPIQWLSDNQEVLKYTFSTKSEDPSLEVLSKELGGLNYLTTTCTTTHRYPIFSMRYSEMCKVCTGYHGTSEIVQVCVPVRSIIPSLKLGYYISAQAHKPCSISHMHICMILLISH